MRKRKPTPTRNRPYFVTKATAGAVTQTKTDCIFMEYTNSILIVEMGFECDKELLAVKKVWFQATLKNIRDDILDLLNEYWANCKQNSADYWKLVCSALRSAK